MAALPEQLWSAPNGDFFLTERKLLTEHLHGRKIWGEADAVLIAHHLPKLGAHLVTALAHLRVNNHARRSHLETGSMRKKCGWSKET
jgi:hypothetical protein